LGNVLLALVFLAMAGIALYWIRIRQKRKAQTSTH
jgi:hypothetical protein